MIKPLGVYGPKVEIVRFLRSLNAVNEDMCVNFPFFCQIMLDDRTISARLLLAPTEIGSSRPALSSGLYVLAAGQVDPTQERHYVIYWPEDSTWNDSAASSVCRNRVTFMRWVIADDHIFSTSFTLATRYLTKMCDQVVALLSAEHSASILWGDDDSDTESVDLETGDDDRLFTYEVAKRNEQEESAVSRPGFQVILSSVIRKSTADISKMTSRHISHYAIPADCALDPSVFVPGLFHGETAQGFWTVTYVPQATQSRPFNQRPFTKLSLGQLL